MRISKDIVYVGVNDHKIDLFEGQFDVPLGMAYNSYVILDAKITVMDSVEKDFADEWLNNIERVCNGNSPTYFIVQHMEPDHSSSIAKFMERYPNTIIVSSAQAFKMMLNFYKNDYKERRIIVTNGSTLDLGNHQLEFVTAPMVHWPEVIMTYDRTEKVLFSADAFGKFGANDVIDPEGWACEARRYYFGIVGKYGMQVQAVLKKIAGLEINTICSLHGPILNDNLDYYLNIYDIWSSYGVESEGVVISYTSVYGNTRKAAELLKEKLLEYGCPKVALNDLAREDIYECVEDAFRYGKHVLASTTYNASVFPKMKEFIHHLLERDYQKRTIAFMENGSWAPSATKAMKELFVNSKNITYLDKNVRINSSLDDDSIAQIDELAKELMK
ncbi:MAG: FprA family A-type flavoprotein [Bacillales bacterium]|nr:FprA family A-type flavoprotein [Bacillales bacterium]